MLVLASILVPVLVTQVAAAPHRWHHHHHNGDNEVTSTEEVDISTPPVELPASTAPVPVETSDAPETEVPEHTETDEDEESTSSPTPTATATTAPTPTGDTNAAAVTNIPVNAKFDYQIGGGYTPPTGVQVVSRDHTDKIAEGLYNICYINAFQTQPEAESFWKNGTRDSLLLRDKSGEYFGDAAWEGEIFLDTSSEEKRTQLAAIVNGWIDECASKGFKAVEFDNLDSFTRSDDLLSKADNLAFAKVITTYAHSKGLAAAQKNTAELVASDKNNVGFDFAVMEECEVWEECDAYTDVYGAHVLEIEYTDSENAAAVFNRACEARKDDISIILRDRLVSTVGAKNYHYEEC